MEQLPINIKDRRLWFVAALTAAAVYLVHKAIRIIRADCDLVLLSKHLKASYFLDKVVWVTGASSGIGEALCYQLSKHGAKLIMSARSESTMETIRSSLAHPDDAKILPLDLSDPAACHSAPEKAIKLFDGVDMLINNAGISQRCFFLDTEDQTHRTMMQINLDGPRTLIAGVLPGMLVQNSGHIVNISSINGKSGMPLRSSYCASKFALNGLTNAIRYELHDKNIHCTIVCPGPVRTAIDRNAVLGDGSLIGCTDKIIQGGMSAERCAELILVATSNKLAEAWVSTKPGLLIPYLSHYCQALLHYVWRRKAPSVIEATTGKKGY